MDTCTMVHFPYYRSLFKTYFEVNGGREIHVENEDRSKVIGEGDVELVFTSKRKITLTNVLHIPNMNRKLESGDFLGKLRIKVVYELGKLVLSRNGNFIGKRLLR